MLHLDGSGAWPYREAAVKGTCRDRVPTFDLIVLLLVGLIAGWLAGKIVQGTGFGVIGDIAIGIVGAFIGTWLLGMFESSSAAV